MTPELNRIYHGDALTVLQGWPDGFIDMILTDPPYPREFLPLWSVLSEQAARLLKPGGYCISYSGQCFLPEVMSRLSEHLKYIWTIALIHRQSQIVWSARTTAKWKPIIVCRNGHIDETGGKIRKDVIKGTGADKNFHYWGQSCDEAIKLIEQYSSPGEIILDPFAGGGTTLVAAKLSERRWLGIDISEKYVEMANKRLENTAINEVMDL